MKLNSNSISLSRNTHSKVALQSLSFSWFHSFSSKDCWMKFSLIASSVFWVFWWFFHLFGWRFVFFKKKNGLSSKCHAQCWRQGNCRWKVQFSFLPKYNGSDQKLPFDFSYYNFLWLSLSPCKFDYFFSAKELWSNGNKFGLVDILLSSKTQK